jgi:hypothetical protein
MGGSATKGRTTSVMRLEHLYRITMRYAGESCWQQPYQRPDGSSGQEFGYGSGEGTITGPRD